MYITITLISRTVPARHDSYMLIFILLFITTLQETVLPQSRFDQRSPLRFMVQSTNNTLTGNINLFHTLAGATQLNVKLNGPVVTFVNKHARIRYRHMKPLACAQHIICYEFRTQIYMQSLTCVSVQSTPWQVGRAGRKLGVCSDIFRPG